MRVMASGYSDQPILDYIDNYWAKASAPTKIKLSNLRNLVMKSGQVKLPNPAVSPNHAYFAGTQYYWDSYFTVEGLVAAGRIRLARGMVDNLCYLYEKFGLVPARNSWTSLGRSQPPFLTRMAYSVFEASGDNLWLDKIMRVAADEYEKVWLQDRRLYKSNGLSMYRPKYFPGRLSAYESGWDMSLRYSGRRQLIPIDLNCLLYQYEKDLSTWCRERSDKAGAKLWEDRSKARSAAINMYLWDEKRRFFYDWDIETGGRSRLNSVAGFFPIWCGLANKKQAAGCHKNLVKFEQQYGLSSTEKLSWQGHQWDYPNGWPPLQLIVIEGLRRYGYVADADRLTQKWLGVNRKVFESTGSLWEKYDVVNGGIGLNGTYPTQPGFAWTNAVFLILSSSANR